MILDRTEIENTIENGKILLSEHPEFFNMTLQDVIDELDDGTKEMRHNRWGVTACLVIESIKNFEIHALVEHLSGIDSGILTYEYVGYLLQKEHCVNLEDLILEADQQGRADKIEPYVCSNLIFEEELYERNICKIIAMLERHMTSNFYRSLLSKYVDHITNMGAQCTVEKILENFNGQVQYDFMYTMRREWYKKDVQEASAVIERMMKYNNIWCKKVAILFWDSALDYDVMIFQQYFLQMKNAIFENEELWLMTIPVFVKYILVMEDHAEKEQDSIYLQVVKYIEDIANGSVEEKCKYIDAIQHKKEIPELLNGVFRTIVLQPFEKSRDLLTRIDTFLHYRMQNDNIQLILQIMLEAFISSKYRADYNEFFEAMNLVGHELLNHKRKITAEALKYMLSSEIEKIFFGLGLLMTVGDITELSKEENIKSFTDEQIIRLMKSVLYFGIDAKKICHIAYQLLEFSEGNCNAYIEFCMREVYGNYPATMNDVAKQYITANVREQVCLAEQVIERKKQLLAEQALCYEIKDLYPSREHQYIYHRAQMETNRQINKNAKEKSLFGQLFSSRTLKYGIRTAHVVIGRKNEKLFQVSPFMRHEYSMELPASYIKDPVTFSLKRNAYLKEVSQDEINYKGLPASTEGEG